MLKSSTTMKSQRQNFSALSVKQLSPQQQQEWIQSLSIETQANTRYDWLFWARDSQLIPDSLLLDNAVNTWLILAGRGFGKTRTGAESVKWLVENANYRHIAIVGRTAADTRDTMIEGVSGLLSVFPIWNKPHYQPSTRTIEFPNGARAITRSADEPDQMRGLNTDLVWGDELAAWQYPESYDQINFGNRIGDKPLQIYTTTPRPTALIKTMANSPSVITTTGTIYENIENLAPSAVRYLLSKYEGTTLGKQELLAQILEGIDGTLWTLALLENCHVRELPRMHRKIIAVDPSAKSNIDSAETGIIACGLGGDEFGYVLEDGSLRGTPHEWATQTIKLFDRWQAELIVVEDNQGGEMVEHTLKTIRYNLPVLRVTSTEDKYSRAQPVASLYEQNRIKHFGVLSELEDQMTTWRKGEKSPDRIDAMVHGIRELMVLGGNTWQNANTAQDERLEAQRRLKRGR